MGRHILEGNPPIEVILRRSARARRLSLRLSRLDGRVTLTLPRSATERDGLAFLAEKEDWLRLHLAGVSAVEAVSARETVLFRGQAHPILRMARGRPLISDDAIHVNGNRPVGAQVKGLFRQHARDALALASDRYAAQLGRNYKKLTLRDTRSRWGSCTADGGLMYSWRLIMAPTDVLDYVAAHEVAHLVEMNHQPAFWAIVGKLCPDYQSHRTWLRQHGDSLHRVSFHD